MAFAKTQRQSRSKLYKGKFVVATISKQPLDRSTSCYGPLLNPVRWSFLLRDVVLRTRQDSAQYQVVVSLWSDSHNTMFPMRSSWCRNGTEHAGDFGIQWGPLICSRLALGCN